MKRVATLTPCATKLKRLSALAAAAAAFASLAASAPAASAYSTPPAKDGCTMTSTPTHSSATCNLLGASYHCYKNAAGDPWTCYRP
jgi:hypothetical protein